jgi:hypothetical protein
MGSFVLAGIIVNGAWTQLDAIGWPMWLLPLVTFALDADRFRLTTPFPKRSARPDWTMPALIAAVLCGLHLLHVALTAREEFGFGGDEGYHLSATRAFALYFIKAGPYLAGVLVAYSLARYRAPRFAASIAMLALIGSSMLLPEAALFGRYPTGFYLLSTPLNVGFEVAGIPYPFTANHVVNVLSVPAWLFVLRPIVIGRWPDWRVLPVALLVYFQGPSIVYAGSGLLEPWAFVCVLLALEAAVALEVDRQWVAVLLAAAATFFKDTAILFVPPIWVLTMVEWRGWRPALRPHAVAVGVAAVAPFVAYYAARRGLHIVRGYEVADAAGVWTAARASEWLAKARYQLGLGGSISVAVVTAGCFLGFRADRRLARQHFIWAITAIALVIFFAADVASISFTGYGRFLAYPLLALCGSLFVMTHSVPDRHRTVLMVATLSMAAAQLPATASVLALDFLPDFERNSLEWHRSLVRLPIRSLARRIPDQPNGAAVSKLRVVTFEIDPISLRVAYPDIARQYELGAPAVPDCACRLATEAVVAGFEWPAHFDNTSAARARYEQQQSTCVAQVRSTCASVALEQHRDGAVVGVLGVGTR